MTNHAIPTGFSRRQLLAAMSAAALAPLAAKSADPAAAVAPAPAAGPFAPIALPYGATALEPTVSATTIGFHHGKHHKTYADTLGKLLAGQPLAGAPLAEIVKQSAGKPEMQAVFNNAAQVWNHDFYWQSMAPGGGGEPAAGKLAEAIAASFGKFADFKEAFIETSASQFGSGWGWLVKTPDGKLKVVKTGNAETPLTQPGVVPLLTVDVWEHAYYLDWQNRRKDYLRAFVEKLANWKFAEANLG